MDVYQLRGQFSFIGEIFSPNVVYCFYIEALQQSLDLELASASLKLTYIISGEVQTQNQCHILS